MDDLYEKMDDLWCINIARDNQTQLNSQAIATVGTQMGERYKCHVCGPNVHFAYTTSAYNEHAQDPWHVQAVGRLVERRFSRFTRLVEADRLIREFGEEALKLPLPMKSLLYEHTFGNESTIQKARDWSVNYTAKERLVALELAIWKAACLLHSTDQTRDVANFYLYGHWKVNKKATRHHSIIESIMVNVVPFLGFCKKK